MRELGFVPLAMGLLAAGSAAQRTWIVDVQKRAGWEHADVESALSAAGDGDTLIVRDGKYPSGATITKGISLIGEGEALLGKPLTITGLAAGRRVAVRNFGFWDPVPLGFGIDRLASPDLSTPAATVFS